MLQYTDNSQPPLPAQYSWRLPKTVFEVSVKHEPQQCGRTEQGTYELQLKIDAALAFSYEPDPNIGEDFENGLITVAPEQLTKSFWQTRNISVKTYSGTQILQSIGSQPKSEAAAILGNLFTTATKLTSFSLGLGLLAVRPERPLADPCVEINAAFQKIQDSKDALNRPDIDENETRYYTALLQKQVSDITITMKRKVDPGAVSSIPGSGIVAVLEPTDKQKIKAKWPTRGISNQADAKITVVMDFEKSSPRVPSHGGYSPTRVQRGTLFREATYIPVLAYHGQVKPANLIKREVHAFAQFGAPRTLPFTAGFFESLAWSVSFQQSGEMTDASFTSTATGVAATSVLSAAAGAAQTIVTDARSAAIAQDADVLKLQNENAALLARINNITYNQQLQKLLATTQTSP